MRYLLLIGTTVAIGTGGYVWHIPTNPDTTGSSPASVKNSSDAPTDASGAEGAEGTDELEAIYEDVQRLGEQWNERVQAQTREARELRGQGER